MVYMVYFPNFPYIYQKFRPHVGKYTTEVYHDHGPYGYSKLFKQKIWNLHVHLEFARFLPPPMPLGSNILHDDRSPPGHGWSHVDIPIGMLIDV